MCLDFLLLLVCYLFLRHVWTKLCFVIINKNSEHFAECCIGLFAFCFFLLIGYNGWCVYIYRYTYENSYISSLRELSFGKWGTHQSRSWLVQFVSQLLFFFSLLFFLPPKSLRKVFCVLFRKVTLKFICFHLCHSWAAVGYIGQRRWIPNLYIQALYWERFSTHPVLFCRVQLQYYNF